jgi:hypothetical protein
MALSDSEKIQPLGIAIAKALPSGGVFIYALTA